MYDYTTTLMSYVITQEVKTMFDHYMKVRIESSSLRERRDCVPVALHLALIAVTEHKWSYKQTLSVFKEAGRRRRCATYWHTTLRAADMMAMKLREKKLKRPPRANSWTARTIGKAYPKGSYLVAYSGHLAFMHDGVVCDHTNGKRNRVTNIYEVHNVG